MHSCRQRFIKDIKFLIFGLRDTSALYATPTHCSPRPPSPPPGLDSVSFRLFIILNIALSSRESGVREESISVLCIVHQPFFCLCYLLGRQLWQRHALHKILITLYSYILDENVMCIGQRQNSNIGARTRQIGIVSVMIRKTQEASKGERVYSKYGPTKLIQTYVRVPYIWGMFGIARSSTRTS